MIRIHKQSTLNCCRFSQIQNVVLVFVPLVVGCCGLANEPLVIFPQGPVMPSGISACGAEGGRAQPLVSTYPCLIHEAFDTKCAASDPEDLL
jgi:hypothetical protein